MAYPTTDNINLAIARFQADPLIIYSYAALHGQLPSLPTDVQNHWADVQGWARNFYGYTNLVVYFINAHGRLPVDTNEIQQWLFQQGFLDAHLQMIGKVVGPDYGYPPTSGNRSSVAIPFSGSSGSAGGPLKEIQAFWAGSMVNKAIVIGGGLLVFKMASGRRGLL